MDFSLARISRRLALAALALAVSSGAQATEDRWPYEVTVTNITYNQQFTPLLLATHKPALACFKPGEPAIPELATLAEEGNVAPLRALLQTGLLVHDGGRQRPAQPGEVDHLQPTLLGV